MVVLLMVFCLTVLKADDNFVGFVSEPIADELIHIDVSLNFHIAIPLSTENFCELSQFYSIHTLSSTVIQRIAI